MYFASKGKRDRRTLGGGTPYHWKKVLKCEDTCGGLIFYLAFLALTHTHVETSAQPKFYEQNIVDTVALRSQRFFFNTYI